MTMQRRHFELIAETLKEYGDAFDGQPIRDAARQGMARMFADKLAATNPQFNRSRFLTACGVED